MVVPAVSYTHLDVYKRQMQKTNKESGPALIGIELKCAEDYNVLIRNLNRLQINYTELNKDDTLFGYLV